MEEEIRMILRMVEEGKISADQAAELIKALEGREGSLDEEAARPPGQAPPRDIQFKDAIRDAVTRALSGVESGLGNLGEVLASWGSGNEVHKDFEGSFEPGGSVSLHLSTTNGSIRLSAWEHPGYKVTVLARMRPGAASERAILDMVDFDAGARSLSLEVHGGWPGVKPVSIVAFVPKDFTYDVELESSNGAIEISGLTCFSVRAETSNGRVRLDDIRAREARLESSNGSVAVLGSVSDLFCETSNGSIEVREFELKGENMCELETSNGAVRVELPDDPELGCSISAETGFGGINIELPGLVYEVNERSIGHNEVRAKTDGYEQRDNRVILKVETSNGKIDIRKKMVA